MSDVGDRIRSARESLNLSQEDLAERVGVSKRTVGNWERGASDPRHALGKIERELGITLRGRNNAMAAQLLLAEANPTQLIAQLADWFARYENRIRDLEDQLEALRGNVVLPGRFAARNRDVEADDE